ncbi:MAG: nicotinate (nicotinamide) nucleotide adenylyltransferase [Clostridiales bacterium]|nr:nicotinate (nicotinamide) nucleotide adenylyltransferase [Clostridiales bacterium]
MKIALFGGAFDPIHNGHLRLAREFARRLHFDRVLLMPTYVPPHKLRADMAPAEDRLAMCRLAVADDPLFEVSDQEIARGGASFTADTLDTLAAERPSGDWALITGADMFLTLGTWHRFSDIARRVLLCTAPRPPHGREELEAYAGTLRRQGARCAVEAIPPRDISSTAVRRAIGEGKPLDGLVPPAVAGYIRERGLYVRPQEMKKMDRDEQFIEIIRGRLSEKRFRHSLAVADQAQRLAELYGADPKKARTAGILHDILKDAAPEEQLQILHDFGILLDNVEQGARKLWHARAGAVFIERVLGVDDRELLDAVRYHTTARAGMTPLDRVLYLADFTSADRDFPDVDVIRSLALKDEQEAMAYALGYTIRELLDKQEAVHPDTVAAYNETMIRRRKGNEPR